MKYLRISNNIVNSASYIKYFLLLYAATFLLIMPLMLYKTKNSLYYIKSLDESTSKDAEHHLNTKRIYKAELFLRNLDSEFVKNFLSASQNIDIVISIITTSRTKVIKNQSYDPKYLTQTSSNIISVLQKSHLAANFPYKIKLFICSVDKKSNEFMELKSMEHYLPVIERFKSASHSTVHILEKEKQDYVFCLNTSLSFHPRYVLLIEDDAVPKSNFFDVLIYQMENHLDKKNSRGEFNFLETNEITYVKFYHPERLLGFWNFDPERLSQLFGYTSIFSALTLCILISSFPLQRTAVLFVLTFMYYMLLFTCIGRANVDEWRNIFSPYLHSYSPAPSCCTPVMLFPKRGAEKVVHYLQNITCKKFYGKDTALDDMHKIMRTEAKIVQPNTFKHIGMYSTLHKKITDPVFV